MSGAADSEETCGERVETVPKVPQRTPLPLFQVFIVFLIQFAEPITATVIYPFINDLVRDTGVTGGDETKTGYYAGLIESLFFISETATVFIWGYASDTFGRKPVLILGPLGLSIAMLGFGWSKTFWPLLVYRCFQGFFNGNIGVSKSVIAEITDKTNIADAYALSPLMWYSGVTIAPIIGGVLSRPADHWPNTLGRIALLREYPYFLPCAVASAIAFVSFAISAVSLKETLPSAKENPLRHRISRLFARPSKTADAEPLLADSSCAEYGAVFDSATVTATPKPKISQLAVPDFISVVVNYGFLAFIDMANSALLPLVYSTPIEYGGLGLEPYRIGVVMSATSITNGVLQTMFIGRIVRRFGPKTMYRVCLHTFLVSFAAFPVANAFARQAGHVDWKTACILAIQLASFLFVGPCYTAMQLLVIEKTPSTNLLGSANAIAQMATSGMRAFGPTAASSLFAISHQRDLAGGQMVFIVLSALTIGGTLGARRLPDSSR
ncbi:major facilitator superfamily domain-containing protein [Coprinopsis sp. MPI-PUGE-AT-0042]|nr:major facilitator superfamily domain-containing protein [Coprinopsis sp. MPI-PUGE-AT-0042]